ncbi:MAG: HAD family hydrolase [Treponema sp.]|nr:HAD family hydrolase [Treponema sp.]
MTPKFSAVAFDLDGTLYPNRRLYVRLMPFAAMNWRLLTAFSKARHIIRREQEEDPATIMPDFYDYQAGLTAKMLKAPEYATRKKIEALMYRGWEPIFTRVKLFPHVKELLAELRAAGLKLGLLSDFPPKTKLENLGLAGLWDTVLCSEEVGALKPSVHPFRVMADELGCPPERILYVGNSRRYDVAGAQRAGMKAALLSGKAAGNPRADFTFRDYRKLRDFVLN